MPPLGRRYNFNLGGLAVTRRRTRDVLEYLVKPRLRTVDRDWEHMVRVLFEGLAVYVPGVSADASLLYLLDVIGVPAPRLASATSRSHRLTESYAHFFLTGMMRVPSIRSWANQEVSRNIKKANSVSSSWKESVRRRSYRYEFLPLPRPFQCK